MLILEKSTVPYVHFYSHDVASGAAGTCSGGEGAPSGPGGVKRLHSQGQGAQGGLRGLIAPQSRAPPQTQQDTVDQRGRGPKTRWGSVTLGWHPGPGTPAIGGGMG